MNAKIAKIVKSPLAQDITTGVKQAAISMVAGLIIGGVVKGVVTVVEIAADAVSGNSQKVA